MPSEYVTDLVDHKRRVAAYMALIANELFKRAAIHDNSKFTPDEFEAYDKAFPNFKKYAFGSEEMQAVYESIRPALQHHFQVNDHHPEHFEAGINDMDLIQVVEMVCDWLAASHRSQTGIGKGLVITAKKYHIDEQLSGIIAHTVAKLVALQLAKVSKNTATH